jgi:hypothetical protein
LPQRQPPLLAAAASADRRCQCSYDSLANGNRNGRR